MWLLLRRLLHQAPACKIGPGFKDAPLALYSSVEVGALQHLKPDGDVKLYRSELSKHQQPLVWLLIF